MGVRSSFKIQFWWSARLRNVHRIRLWIVCMRHKARETCKSSYHLRICYLLHAICMDSELVVVNAVFNYERLHLDLNTHTVYQTTRQSFYIWNISNIIYRQDALRWFALITHPERRSCSTVPIVNHIYVYYAT